MKTLEQVQADAERLGVKIVSAKKSFAELHKHLKENEEILTIVDSLSLIVVTNERFLRIKTNLFSPTDVKDIPLKSITNIEIDAGFLTTKIWIITAGGKTDVILDKKEKANKLKDVINDAISNSDKDLSADKKVNVYEQLEKLANLKEKGVLTEEEFKIQKERLLS